MVYRKFWLVVILLFLWLVIDANALELNLNNGVEVHREDFVSDPGLLKMQYLVLELAISTSPLLQGFQQEIGLRIAWSHQHLVFRSWWSFPWAESAFIRERLRVGFEYSPVFLDHLSLVWPPKTVAAVRISIQYNKLTTRFVRDFYLTLGLSTWRYPTTVYGWQPFTVSVIQFGSQPHPYLGFGIGRRRRLKSK